MKNIEFYLGISFAFVHVIFGFTCVRAPFNPSHSRLCMVSEIHIPGYRDSKIPFILTANDLAEESGTVMTSLREEVYTSDEWESLIPYQEGHLVHKTKRQVFTSEECRSIVDEAERKATEVGWTTNRHGNYPTTDIPIVEVSPHVCSVTFGACILEYCY